jgi:hypothetical protein
MTSNGKGEWFCLGKLKTCDINMWGDSIEKGEKN